MVSLTRTVNVIREPLIEKTIVIFAFTSVYPGELVGPSVTLLDFHYDGVSGPLQSVRRLQDVMYFLKAKTNSF